ncbi:SET domain-containing protein [Streptomyces sp. A7024]|uniref:SET domain-containing protein n=1 Tax=Streptomyces coryli TaxID=1128680 RepID=A0A6G4UCN8_9ACTN|nr:SET domain-containing protein-lysine N-methyltransferase [Streptomyces coryli]NGN69480.1 SET domain-containing protein [Streptomyces coryli]
MSPVPPYPEHTWLSPKAEVRDSPIEGRGLFAVAAIRRDEPVQRSGGRLIDDAELAALTPPHSSFTVGPGQHLLMAADDPGRYGNHSCDPNLWLADAVTMTARRDIAPGEELTSDYATLTGIESYSMPCRCGTPACRGTVTGADWQLPALRTAYGSHWSPALLARMAR